MRAALLATTVVGLSAMAHAQSIDQGTAQMIMNTQHQQVPNGECFSGTCYPITFQQGDVVLSGSATDAQGNVWSLAPASCGGNGPANWWSALYENGQQKWCGYDVAIRIVNGVPWVEEAKGGGWSIPGTGQYVGNPGQGGGGQAVSAPIVSGSAANTASAAPATPAPADPSPTLAPNAPCQEAGGNPAVPGAVTPSGGSFTANGNTYSINATDTDVASINGAPINAGAYETSQLVQGSDGQIYGQSNAAANGGQWFTLQGSGSDTWWQTSSAPPASTTSASTGLSGTQTMATAAGPVVCPTTPSIQAQISADNQEIQQLMAQIHAYQTTPTATTQAPIVSTTNGGTQ